MKKLLPVIVALLLIAVFGFISCTVKNKIANPKNIQAKVINVIEKTNKYIYVECVTMGGDCLFVKYYSTKNLRLVKNGSWLSIYGGYGDKQDKWITAKIKLGNYISIHPV